MTRQGDDVEYGRKTGKLVYGVLETTEDAVDTPYLTEPVEVDSSGYNPQKFAEAGFPDTMAYAIAEGLAVEKVTADHAGNIQAAIDAAELAGPGSIVWFDQPGVYVVGAQLNISERIHFVGHSRNPADTVLQAGANIRILVVNAGATMKASETNRLRENRLLIRDITFDGDGQPISEGIRIINTGVDQELKYATIENCVAYDMSVFGFSTEGLTGGVMEDIVLDSCEMYRCRNGFKSDSGAISDFLMTNCLVHDCDGTGAYMRSHHQGFRVENSRFENNGEYAMIVEGNTLREAMIRKCHFAGNGWQVGPNNPGGILFYNADDADRLDMITVEDCTFLLGGQFQPFTALDGDDFGHGINLKLKAEASNFLIQRCDFRWGKHFGFYALARDGEPSWFHDIEITECNFRGAGLAGVGCDDMSGYAASIGELCSINAVGNWWGSDDGAADAPTELGYTPAEYIGAGNGGSGDAALRFTPVGYKKVFNEGETNYRAQVLTS